MNCSCGTALTYSTHLVTTENGKAKWIRKPVDGVLRIENWSCETCGRIRYKVWGEGNVLLKTFG